ncbi:MAG: ribosomal protein S18-alanine N-acetyltransferase, partial [Chloroflexota bacterium]|nr:ribosomal protein S18-alanine N-acetyltransferase [Chloroflexota bacterium]
MRLIVEDMDLEDISRVIEVDRESYTLPWPASAYRREILHNRNAKYLVLRELAPGALPRGAEPEADSRPRLPFGFFRKSAKPADKPADRGRIVGYAGMWLMVDEAHITTIAVLNDWRGQGLGELLLVSLIQQATAVYAHRMTLEVRVSNETAQKLYRKYGFAEEGVRPRYYSDNNEDAYIMSTKNIQ